MADFWTEIDDIFSTPDDNTDIRAMVRRAWFFDFQGYPVRLWQGQGKLYGTDGSEWLGTVDAQGRDVHTVPRLNDGRDGSSATYSFTLSIPTYPGTSPLELYNAMKAEQYRVAGRDIIAYLALFKVGEGLRPSTPMVYYKQLTMIAPKFSEKIVLGSSNQMIKQYSVTISAKDGNIGRSNVPGGTYADSVQKERARQKGVALDRGCEFLARLANRTYQLP